MARTITVDTGEQLRDFVEDLVDMGDYKNKSEVIREGLRLLKEKHAKSNLTALRKLIDDGENSGDLVAWDIDQFLADVESLSSK